MSLHSVADLLSFLSHRSRARAPQAVKFTDWERQTVKGWFWLMFWLVLTPGLPGALIDVLLP